MTDDQNISHQLSVQLLHWELAIGRLQNLNEVASPEGWRQLERQTGAVLRSAIQKSLHELRRNAARIRASSSSMQHAEFAKAIHGLRRDYLRTETMLDFFADAINSRSSEATGRLLLGLDRLADIALRGVLEPLGHATPPVVTYIDKGLGASILKAGLRLWDRRSINPAASVKVVRHNVLTATSILHEIGHQIGHMTGWNDELRMALRSGLPNGLSQVWSSWASEIAADAIAFAYAGHASISALRTVVDGGPSRAFRFIPGDPHPISMLRVLVVSEFAKDTIDKSTSAPWVSLENSWKQKYPIRRAPRVVGKIVQKSIPELPKIAGIVMRTKFKSLGNKALVDIVDPRRVSPVQLQKFEYEAGPRAFNLAYIVKSEPIRLLALSGLRISTDPARGREYYQKQYDALQVLGSQELAA